MKREEEGPEGAHGMGVRAMSCTSYGDPLGQVNANITEPSTS